MIHVIAIIRCKPGAREAVLDEFRQIIASVRAEDGCIEYAPAVDARCELPTQHELGADAFMVVEKWRDLDALKAHSTAPHMLAYREKVKDHLVRSEVSILDPAE